MIDKGRKVWRGGIHYDCSRKDGVGVFAHYGHVSPCGEWVDGGSVRWPLTAEWCDTEAEALARLAPEIAEIGGRLINQAAKLLDGARPSRVDKVSPPAPEPLVTPALPGSHYAGAARKNGCEDAYDNAMEARFGPGY